MSTLAGYEALIKRAQEVQRIKDAKKIKRWEPEALPKKPSMPRAASLLEETLLVHIRDAKLPMPAREYQFHDVRRWKFDFAWPDKFVAVECEGGTKNNGRHNRAKGFENDCEKYNFAVLGGWRVLRFTMDQIQSLQAIKLITAVLNQ